MTLLDTVIENSKRLGLVPPDFQPGRIIPQQRATTQPLIYHSPTMVRLLVDHPAHVKLKADGTPAKRQPKPWKPGDKVYARLDADGSVSLVPFSMAGQGWEIIKDAVEGVHYAFLK